MGFMRADMTHDAKTFDKTLQDEATALSFLTLNIDTPKPTIIPKISECSRGSGVC
jgi:hypothetical protein